MWRKDFPKYEQMTSKDTIERSEAILNGNKTAAYVAKWYEVEQTRPQNDSLKKKCHIISNQSPLEIYI